MTSALFPLPPWQRSWSAKPPDPISCQPNFSYSWEGTDHIWDWIREHGWKKVVPSQSLSSPFCFIFVCLFCTEVQIKKQFLEQELFSPGKGGQKQGDVVFAILFHTQSMQQENLSALHRWRAALSGKDVFWVTLPITTA